MDWDDVRYFLSLARLGSVRAAGAALDVSHSTVARRVEALEERLATRLFDRTRDGYSLTKAGLQMLPGAERVEREMAQLERSLVGQDERFEGTVRLTCCDEFVSGMMLQELTEFCATYPDLELQVTTDSRSYDLSKREADIAVRMLGAGDSPPEHLVGRKLVSVFVANYVATAHAHRLDPDIEGNTSRWIAFEPRKYLEMRIAASSYPNVPAWGSFSSLAVIAQAARSGHGIVMLPCYVGDSDPALRRLANPDLAHAADLWLLCHPDLRDNVRFAATRKCVGDALTRRTSLFAGRAEHFEPLTRD